MKWSHSRTADAAAGVLLLAAPASAMLRCNHVQVDGQKFDFEPLSGPHSVVTWQDRPPYMFNTTYTLDLCAPLKKSGDAPSKEQCPNFTRGEPCYTHPSGTTRDAYGVPSTPFENWTLMLVDAMQSVQ